MLAFSRSSPFGHGIVRVMLVRREVVLHERRRPDFSKRSAQLGGGLGDQHHEAVLRIGLELRMRTCLFPSLSVNVIDGLARGDVDDLDLLHLRFDGVEARPVARQRRAARDARLERDRADDFRGRLVDDPELVREGADVERAVAGADRLLAAAAICADETGSRDQRSRARDRQARRRKMTASASARRHATRSYGKTRSILRQSFWAAAHLLGPVGRVIQLVGHLRRPVAADVAVEEVALDRLAEPRRAARAIRFPARREHQRAAERNVRRSGCCGGPPRCSATTSSSGAASPLPFDDAVFDLLRLLVDRLQMLHRLLLSTTPSPPSSSRSNCARNAGFRSASSP